MRFYLYCAKLLIRTDKYASLMGVYTSGYHGPHV